MFPIIKHLTFICLICTFSPSCGLICGKAGAPPENTRIVGGQVSQPGQWPWMAIVAATFTESDGVNRTYQCGGSIINEEWVLTAAHCLQQTSQDKLVVVKLMVGGHDITAQDGSEIKLIAEKVVIHEEYDASSNVNDIGLLKLNSKLDLSGSNPRIGAVCLPVNRQTIDRSRCYGTGWGRTSEGGQASTVLRHVKLPIQNNISCGITWGLLYHSQNQLCAGYLLGGRDTCQGDSGGPLVCPFGDGLWLQEGVTSFGIGCARPIMPGVYTRVSHYVPWIARISNAVLS